MNQEGKHHDDAAAPESADESMSQVHNVRVPYCGGLINRSLRYPGSLLSRFQIAYYRLCGARIGPGCTFRGVEIHQHPWEVFVGPHVCLDRHVSIVLPGPPAGKMRLVFKGWTYCNRFTLFAAAERIEVGEDVMIGPHCFITDHDHGIERGKPIRQQPYASAPVVIEDNVWIGAGVCVLKGVRIGREAVVAAGAVVTKDVPEGAIVAGVPARVLRMRPVGSSAQRLDDVLRGARGA
ncbi:acyltransferase [Candidatus Parcubacteria bacterium]|nr:MAG: acyltransferase [Candidatus Parcubacteria bacterium]